MNRKFLSPLAALLLAGASVSAQSNLELQTNDSMEAVLQRQSGQSVELRMKSGEKLAGKVVKVSDKLVHLTQLTGAEYFDAMVAIDDVAAVIVRTKK